MRPGARPAGAPAVQLRVVRAALFTALCTTLSAASHVLLSHAPLPPAAVAAICAGVFAAACPPTGRKRGYRAVAGLLVPLEPAAVFTAGQHTCYGPAGGVGLLAAGWLHRGDAALDALLRAAAAATFRPLLTAAAVAAAALLPPRRRVRPLHPLPPARPLPLLVHCVRRRGPPRPAAV